MAQNQYVRKHVFALLHTLVLLSTRRWVEKSSGS